MIVGTGGRKTMSLRLSERQKLLGECVTVLLRIFYRKKKESKLGSSLDEDAYNGLNVLIRVLYNSELSYDEEDARIKFDYPTPMAKSLSKDLQSGYLRYNEKQFRKLVNSIILEVKNEQKKNHMLLLGVTDKIKTEIAPETTSRDPYEKIMKRGISELNGSMIQLIKKGENRDRKKDKGYQIDVFRSRHFRVKPISELGHILLKKKIQGSIRLVPNLSSPDIKTFGDLSRWIFVHFYLEFNGFERLNLCKKCGHLFYSKKSSGNHSKKFCGDLCRTYFFRLENSENFKCRARQNAWASSRGLIDRIGKESCENCKPHPTSYCPKFGSYSLEVMEEFRNRRRSRIKH